MKKLSHEFSMGIMLVTMIRNTLSLKVSSSIKTSNLTYFIAA